jgi:tetratricopeptide (TPR) repeat protein
MMHLAIAFLVLLCIAQANLPAQSPDWTIQMEKGNALRHTGNYREAAVAFQQVVNALGGSESQRHDYASALNALATMEDDLGQPLEAERHYRHALEVVEEANGMRSVSRAQILVNLACNYLHRSQLAPAERILREVLALYSELESSGDLKPGSRLVAVARSCLGAVLLWQGSLDEGTRMIGQSLAVMERDTTEHDGLYGMTINNMGSARWSQGRRDEATTLFEQAVAVIEVEGGAENPKLVYPLNNLAFARSSSGRQEEAVTLYRRAVLIAQTHLGPTNPLYGQTLMNLATCLKKSGHKAEAKNMEQRATVVLKDSGRVTGAGLTVDIVSLRAR